MGRTSILIAFGSLVVSGITYYHTSQQTSELQCQTREFEHKNDLKEVSQGLISKESYAKKYPNNT